MQQQLVGTSISLAASIYLLTHSKCEACKTKSKTLALAGAGFYSLLLFGVLNNKEWVNPAIRFAALTHSLLIAKMLKDDSICPGCLVAAAGNYYSFLTS